jgi:hypothetical protein
MATLPNGVDAGNRLRASEGTAQTALDEAIERLVPVSPEECVEGALQSLHSVVFAHKDRDLAREVWDVLKVACAALVPTQKLVDAPEASFDSLTRLRDRLSGNAKENREADMRTLVELVERRVPWVEEYGERGVENETPGLVRDTRARLGSAFAAVPETVFRTALQRLLRPSRKGGARPAGVAADLIMAARIWGYREGGKPDADGTDGRARLQKDIAKAVRRGKAKRRVGPEGKPRTGHGERGEEADYSGTDGGVIPCTARDSLGSYGKQLSGIASAPTASRRRDYRPVAEHNLREDERTGVPASDSSGRPVSRVGRRGDRRLASGSNS